eukprot:m.128283 g.128283  ORF g.128283 m.128283 type:complete len:132 (+) comp17426_c0_seq1:407-802(+)
MAADWALLFFGPAGDAHASIFLFSLWCSILLGALKIDDYITASWWTVMSPLVTSATLSLYLYFITCVRLRMDLHANRMLNFTILPILISSLLLILWIMSAAVLEHGTVTSFEAIAPVFCIVTLTFMFPRGP